MKANGKLNKQLSPISKVLNKKNQRHVFETHIIED